MNGVTMHGIPDRIIVQIWQKRALHKVINDAHVHCFCACIYLNICVFVTVFTVTVLAMKEQSLLLMV